MVEGPTISVVIPAHNEEKRIRRALESVLSSTIPPTEVLVILDRCSDNTGNVAESLRDGRVRCFDNNGAPGLAGALNTGLTHASAELVARLDADDVQLPNRFELQVPFLQQHSLDVCCGWAEVVDSGGKQLFVQRTPLASEEIRRGLGRANVIIHSTVLMRRNRVLSAGGYRRTRWEDYDLWVRLSRSSFKFGCVPRVVVTREFRQEGYAHQQATVLGRIDGVRHRLRAIRALAAKP